MTYVKVRIFFVIFSTGLLKLNVTNLLINYTK